MTTKFTPRYRQHREQQARDFAVQLGVDPDELVAATDAVWSNMNPQSTLYASALSIAGVALRAAAGVKPPELPNQQGHTHG